MKKSVPSGAKYISSALSTHVTKKGDAAGPRFFIYQGAVSLFLVDSSMRFLIASISLAASHRFSKSFSCVTWAIAINALR
jgi:hypothetical protein